MTTRITRNANSRSLSTLAVASVTLADVGFDGFGAARGERDVERRLRERLIDARGVEEAIAVRTCQRVELYARGDRASEVVVDVLADEIDVGARTIVRLTGEEAVTHLFRVAAGLESGVLGEDEILGQLRGSYHRASEAGALGSALDTIALKALRVGERARAETGIGEGAVSLGSVTADLAEERLGGLEGASVAVLGAGEVAELVVAAIARRPERLGRVVVANRTLSGAEALADRVDGEAVPLELLPDALSGIDLLVSATGAAETVLSRGDLEGVDLLAIDLANPRDVDPTAGGLPGIELLPLDAVLSARTDGIESRRRAIPSVERIVNEERRRLRRQLRAERVDELLSEIYSRAHEIREAELTEALSTLEAMDEPFTERQEATLREFSVALVNTLLHPKTAALRQAAASGDRETVDAWLRLLDSDGHANGDRGSDG